MYFILKDDETNCKPRQIIQAVNIIFAKEIKTRLGCVLNIIKRIEEVSSPIYTNPEENIRDTIKKGIKKIKLSSK